MLSGDYLPGVLRRSQGGQVGPRSHQLMVGGKSSIAKAPENITLILHAKMPMDSFNHYCVIDLIPIRASKLATEICLMGNILCKPDSLLYLFRNYIPT